MTAPVFARSSFCSQNGCVEVAAAPDGSILLRDGKRPASAPHQFSIDDWDRFVTAVKAGKFDTATLIS